VIAHNSTNINKTNNSKSLNTQEITTYADGNADRGLQQAQTCRGIKLV